MQIIKSMPNKSGAYPPAQSWNGSAPPDGYVQVAPGVELTCGGFGTPTIENGIMTAWTGNETAWAAWQAENPEQATEPDNITQTQIALVELAETEAAHDLENKLALAELAEMMGGTSIG